MSIVSERIISNRMKRIEARRKALQDDLKKTVDILITYYPAKRIILFGSMITGKVSQNSDIDLIVEGLGDQFIKALGHCMKECQTKIDIKPLEDLDPQFRKTVLEKGILMYESGK
jgi:predicted nucleotidyltransferase